MNMNAVGIDISKRKSTVAILRPGGQVVVKPFDVPHLSTDFQSLQKLIRELDGETRIVMEFTGRYYEPVARELSQAGFFVSAVNPQIIRNFQGQDNPLRKVKTDKADSVKIARYTLDSWANLKQYSLMDELRSQLKTMNHQFDFYMKHKTAMKNNLIGLIDQTYPGANTYFDSPAREDGSQKWVDFIDTYYSSTTSSPLRAVIPISNTMKSSNGSGHASNGDDMYKIIPFITSFMLKILY